MSHLHTGDLGKLVSWLIGSGDLRVGEAKVVELRASLAAPAESELVIALFLVYPGPELMDNTATVTMGSVLLSPVSHTGHRRHLYRHSQK